MITNEMNDLKDLASTVSFYTFCYLALFWKQRTKCASIGIYSDAPSIAIMMLILS